MSRAWLGVAAAAICSLPAARAWATPCVSMSVTVPQLGARQEERLLEQLRASLDRHGIATCEADEAPLATLTFEAEDRARSSVTIRVRDAVTEKELSREVRLGRIPPDGRPLALAVAADELLRASWAEIALADAPEPPAPAPVEVQEAVRDSLPPPAPRDALAPSPRVRIFYVGVSATGEHATGGLTMGGIDARAGVWVLPRLAVTLRLGARTAPVVDAPDGSAQPTALLVGAGLALALLPRGGAFTLEVPLRGDVERVQFTAHPAPNAVGTDRAAVGVIGSSGLTASWRVARSVSIDGEATAGVVVRAIEATDVNAPFAALSGAQLGVALGVRIAP